MLITFKSISINSERKRNGSSWWFFDYRVSFFAAYLLAFCSASMVLRQITTVFGPQTPF